jgi:ABC-type multidrug transport system ATPase subunit
MKVIAIGGEPGTGKTTLMRHLITRLGPFEKHYKDFSLVPYLSSGEVCILGKYQDGETFAGTDRMSMSCQVNVCDFIEACPWEARPFS